MKFHNAYVYTRIHAKYCLIMHSFIFSFDFSFSKSLAEGNNHVNHDWPEHRLARSRKRRALRSPPAIIIKTSIVNDQTKHVALFIVTYKTNYIVPDLQERKGTAPRPTETKIRTTPFDRRSREYMSHA